ncbi:MAG: YraN family protein [Pirellulales bacterium]
MWHLWRRLWQRKPLTLGARGEAAAARYLKRKGYQIVARSDSGKFGELDIVAVDKRTVVFVEVKTRRSAHKGHPVEAVDRAKRRKITWLAAAYLKRHRLSECRSRFDIVAITWPDDVKRPTIEHYPNAFDAED